MVGGQRIDDLPKIIRKVFNGETMITVSEWHRVYDWYEGIEKKREKLSRREFQILMLISDGLDNVTIAKRLSISVKTVERNVTGILRKLEVASRLEAAVWMHKNYLTKNGKDPYTRD
jgi:DNA-binding NarL/FixJ family response regulator